MARTLVNTPEVIGVIGAGVMGAGIAQLSALAGFKTLIFDSSQDALEKSVSRIHQDLDRGVERGFWSAQAADTALKLIHPARSYADLADVELVIEAVFEDYVAKIEVMDSIQGNPVIATNTSSLSVTAIAAHAKDPQRVVGMHFFNPPPLMRLVEIVAGTQSTVETVMFAESTARSMGRTTIRARDSVGFVVNRLARPFYTEALALVEDGISTPEQIDRICRLGGRFRMGPFELMDLVGLDTGLAVADSFAQRSLGEPRWKPSPTQRRLVEARRFGRKSGQGWYSYPHGRTKDPVAPSPNIGVKRRIAVLGSSAESHAFRRFLVGRGHALVNELTEESHLTIVFDAGYESEVGGCPTVLINCAARTLAASHCPRAVGFSILPPFGEASLVEFSKLPGVSNEAASDAERFAVELGLHIEWVDDSPGLVLARIVSQIVNEACFAAGQGVALPPDLDTATTLGLNHPWGPVEWGERIGWRGTLDRIDGMWNEQHDERFRAAPLLRRAATLDLSIRELVSVQPPRGVWS